MNSPYPTLCVNVRTNGPPFRCSFATGSSDATVRVWSLSSGEQLAEFESPGDECTALAFVGGCAGAGLALGAGEVRGLGTGGMPAIWAFQRWYFCRVAVAGWGDRIDRLID
jgi:WD40 repeat protein